MTIRPGARLLQFRVTEKIGAGGMGEVWRAEDTRLGREVAIKLLPGKLRRDPERLARLEREARSLATLNHPQIATLHGLEEDEDGTRFLVMELVEGETLAARLERGALPLAEVCTVGAQVAEALAAAHECGIVHRDLKPGNVMLTRSGVKLLDFGLAKAMDPAPGAAAADGPDAAMDAAEATEAREGDGGPGGIEAAEARTVAAVPDRLTREGTLLGTFHYMAPEQLEGHEADARSDVWALGAMLHEMATGRPAFEGGSPASLIAAILEHEPAPVSEVCELAPPTLDHLVATCLVKDPDRRRQSAGDLALDLRWLATEGVEEWSARAAAEAMRGGARPGGPWRRWLPWAAGAALLAAVAILAWAWTLGPGPESGVPGPAGGRRAAFEIAVPALDWNATESGLAVSPDGDAVAYMSEPAPGRPPVLRVREIDSTEWWQVPGTEGAANPFWSPDGRRLGYVEDGAIRVVRVGDRGGGPAETIASGLDTTFGPPSWSSDGTIVFSGGPRLERVPADGGEPVEMSVPPEGIANVFPGFLPGGRRFLYLEVQGTAARPNVLYIGSLDVDEVVRIEGVHSRAEYAAGHLLYWDQGALVARPFDLDAARFTGDPVTLGEMPGAYNGRTGMAEFSVARNGATVAYGSTAGTEELRWFDATGRELARLGEPDAYGRFRISPHGDRVAIETVDPSTGAGDVSIFDLQRGVPARTFGGPGDESTPVWGPEDRRIAYSSDSEGPPRIYVRSADGSGDARLVDIDVEGPQYVRDWSADGRYLAVSGEAQDFDLHLVPMDGSGPARPIADGPGLQTDARFSPDSRWIAFSSEEPGRLEVFVGRVDGGGVPQRVSSGGGRHPAWHPDGRELYYVNGATVYAVSFSTETGEIGRTRELFSLAASRRIAWVDVAPDGERFLVAVGDRADSGAAITVLLDWFAELE